MICSYKVKLKDGSERFFENDTLFSAFLAGDGAYLVQEFETSKVIDQGTNIITAKDVLKRGANRNKKKGDEGGVDDLANKNDLYRKMVEGTYEKLDTAEIQWFKDTFKDYPIVLETTTQLINGNNWGRFTTDATYLYENAAKGTAYHEAWHNFTQLFLTKPEKRLLYDEVRKTQEGTDKEIEEYLADKFMDFAQSGGTQLPTEPITKNVFQKIWDFIKALFGAKTIDVNKLFLDLYSGNLNTYDYNKANAIWGTLNSSIKNKAGKEIVSVELANTLFNHFDSLTGKWLNDNNLYYNNLLTKNSKDKQKLTSRLKKHIATELDNVSVELFDRIEQDGGTSQQIVLLDKLYDFADTPNDLNTVLDRWINSLTSSSTKKDKEEFESENEETETEEHVETEMTTEEMEEVGQRTGDFAQKSVIDIATKETKALIRTISKVVTDENGLPKRDLEGNIIYYKNVHGLNEPVNFSMFFNNLSFILADSLNFDEMVERLKDPENQKRLPEIALLLERLKFEYSENNGVISYQDPSQDNEFKRQLRAAFERDFNKSYVGVFDATLIKRQDPNDPNADTLVHFFAEETKQGTEFLKKKYFDQFMSLPQSKYIGKTEDQRNYLTPAFLEVLNRFLTKSFKSGERANDFVSVLGLLGITLSPQTIKSGEFKELANNGFKINGFMENISRRLNAKQVITNPIADMKKFATEEFDAATGNLIATDIFSLSGFFFDLLKIEAKYNTETSSLTYLTAEGTKKFALMNPSLLFMTMNRIKKARNANELFEVPQFSYLNPENNESVKSSLVLNSLFNLNPESPAFGNRKRIGDNRVELEFGDYNGFKTDMDGKEVKKQTTSLSVREKIIMDINNLLNKGFVDIMRTEASASSYFYKLSHYIHKNSKGQLFASREVPFDFDTMFNRKKDFKAALDDYFWNLYQFEVKDGFGVFANITDSKTLTKEELSSLMSDFFKQETADFTKYASLNGVFSKDGSIPTNIISNELKDKLAFATQVEPRWNQLIYAFVVNDFILNVEYTKIISGAPKYYKSYHKRAKIAISTGIPMSTASFNKTHLERTQGRTMRFALTGENWDVNLDIFKARTVKDEFYKIKDSLLNSWRMALREVFDETKFSKYNEATSTDGQGRITLDGYREFRIRVGNWGLPEEATYIREVTDWKTRKGIPLTTQDRNLLKIYENEESVVLGVIKAQYAGHVVGKGHKPVAHKFSLAPLIPSSIEGTPMDDFNDHLLRTGTMYFTHESGSKVYKKDVADFFDKNGISIQDKGDAEFYSQFLKEQLPTKSEVKDESTWGSQMRKLFIANMFNEGIANEEFSDLYVNYIAILEGVEENEKQKLYKDFGITENEGVITISDVKPFIETLLKQIEARDLNSNLKESIQYDEASKTFKYPLEINLNRQDVINLISGMIDKRLRRISVAGDQLTMISPSGMLREGEELAFYEPEFDAQGKFIRTKPMEIKIGFSKEYQPLLNLIHPDGKKIGTRERLNEAIRNTEWKTINEESISLVGYRIPTQGPNSMDFMVVKEFFPETFYGIIVPKEYVVKSGADYDIDKIYVMRNVLNNAGKPTKIVEESEATHSIGKVNYITHLLKRGFKEEMNELEIAKLDDYDLNLDMLSKDTVNFRRFKEEVEEHYKQTRYRDLSVELDNISLSIELLKEDIKSHRRKMKSFSVYAGISNADALKTLTDEKEAAVTMLAVVRKNLFDALNKDKNISKEIKQKFNDYLLSDYNQDMVNKLDYANQLRDPKNQYLNTVIEIYKDALSSPHMFEQLVTPNSSDTVREVAVYIGDLVGKDGIQSIKSKVDIKNTDIFKSKSNYIKFQENLSGRNDLGAWAVNNTFSQLLQQAGVKLNNSFKHYYDVYTNVEGITRKEIHVINLSNSQLLLSPEEISNSGLTVSKLLNAEENLKQEIISELINATVDIAADPFYAYLGVNNDNKGPLIFLLQQGVPFKRAILFINQPVLRKFYQARINEPFTEAGMGLIIPSTNKFMKEFLGLDVYTKKTKVFQAVEALTSRAKYFTEDEMENYIKRGEGRDQEVMAYFVKLMEQAKMFRNVQMTNSYDTTKYATPLAATQNKEMENKVKRSEMFSNTDNIKTKSLVSVFDNRDSLIEIFESLFPYGYNEAMVTFYSTLSPEVYSKKDRDRFEKVVSADFIEFIVKNFAKVGNETLGTYGINLMKPQKGLKLLYESMVEINSKHPELKQNFELFKKMLTNFEVVENGRKNIEILRGLDNTVDYQNLLVEEYKRLINFTGDMINKNVSNEDVLQIRKFMTDLAILGFTQSGFNKSKLFFSDIIPNELTNQLFTDALSRFKKSHLDSGKLQDALLLFKKQFRMNNREFFGGSKGQSYRGKPYGYTQKPPQRPLDIKDEKCK